MRISFVLKLRLTRAHTRAQQNKISRQNSSEKTKSGKEAARMTRKIQVAKKRLNQFFFPIILAGEVHPQLIFSSKFHDFACKMVKIGRLMASIPVQGTDHAHF